MRGGLRSERRSVSVAGKVETVLLSDFGFIVFFFSKTFIDTILSCVDPATSTDPFSSGGLPRSSSMRDSPDPPQPKWNVFSSDRDANSTHESPRQLPRSSSMFGKVLPLSLRAPKGGPAAPLAELTGKGAASDGREEPNGNPPKDIVDAILILDLLFKVFDSAQTELVHTRSLRRVKKALGDNGGTEVKTLLLHLHEASRVMLEHEASEPSTWDTPELEARRSRRSLDSASSAEPTTLPRFSVGGGRLSLGDDGQLRPEQMSSRARLGSIAVGFHTEQLLQQAANSFSRSKTKTKTFTRSLFFSGASSWLLSTADSDDDSEDEHSDHNNKQASSEGGPAVMPLLRLGGGASGALQRATAIDDPAEAELAAFKKAISNERNRKALTREITARIDNGDLHAIHVVRAVHLCEILLTTGVVRVKPGPHLVADGFAELFRMSISLDMKRRGSLLASQAREEADADRALASWDDLLHAMGEERQLPRAKAGVVSSWAQRAFEVLGVTLPSCITRARQLRKADDAQGDGSERRWWVILHTSAAWRAFHHVFLLLLVWDALTLPILLVNYSVSRHLSWIEPVAYVFDAYYFARIPLQFCVTFVNEKSVVVHDPAKIRHHYLTHEFVLDLLASWPHDLMAIVLGAEEHAILALRLVKLLNCRYRPHRRALPLRHIPAAPSFFPAASLGPVPPPPPPNRGPCRAGTCSARTVSTTRRRRATGCSRASCSTSC
jgi:hypothetical protein